MAVRPKSATGATLSIDDTSPRRDIRFEDAHAPRVKLRWGPPAICCGLYVVLAMLVYGHFASLGPGHMTGTLSTDAIEQDWWLAWTGFALPHGHNVLSAQWQNYPLGENFGAQCSMLALGVLFLPITKLLGPVVAWNIALRLAVAVSASSMCLVLRRWTKVWPAAFVGGLIYGFSGYMANYGTNYLFLVFVPLPPIIFLLLHEVLVRQRWRPARVGLLLGAVCVLQFFIWSEILASTVVMGVIACVLFLLVDRHQSAERWRYAGTALAYGVGLSGLLLVFPVVFTFAGPQSIKGGPGSSLITNYPTDLLAPFVPSKSQWLGTGQFSAIANHWYAYSEALYIGLPLVIALVAFAIFLRRRRTILFAGSLTLIAFVLSLGPRLWIDGHKTTIPLPLLVLEHLPVLSGFTPERFSLYTALFGAATFAIGLDELWARMTRSFRPAWSRRWRLIAMTGGLAVLTAAVLIPLAPSHTQPTTETKVPTLFTSTAVNAIPAGSVVLAYPYPDLSGGLFFQPPHDIMLYQAVADMRFKLIGGYGWFPPPAGTTHGVATPTVLRPKSVQSVFDAAYHGNGTPQTSPFSETNVTALRTFLRIHDVQTVIVLPQGAYPAVVTNYVTAAIGAPVQSGGVTAWFNVKQRLRVHVASVGGASAEAARKPTTSVLTPANGATLSGTTSLDATTRGYFKVTKVGFYLSGGTGQDTLIASAELTPYGWAASWNTTTVPNGSYTLRSVAYNSVGATGTSTGISITVSN